MNTNCLRLSVDSSLYSAFKAASVESGGAIAVVDGAGLFVGSLSLAALTGELTRVGWHCGHAALTDAFTGMDSVGIGTLIDHTTPVVLPEVSVTDVVAKLVLSPVPLSEGSLSGALAAFVAVVDNGGRLLGTITHVDLITGLLAVEGAL